MIYPARSLAQVTFICVLGVAMQASGGDFGAEAEPARYHERIGSLYSLKRLNVVSIGTPTKTNEVRGCTSASEKCGVTINPIEFEKAQGRVTMFVQLLFDSHAKPVRLANLNKGQYEIVLSDYIFLKPSWEQRSNEGGNFGRRDVGTTWIDGSSCRSTWSLPEFDSGITKMFESSCRTITVPEPSIPDVPDAEGFFESVWESLKFVGEKVGIGIVIPPNREEHVVPDSLANEPVLLPWISTNLMQTFMLEPNQVMSLPSKAEIVVKINVPVKFKDGKASLTFYHDDDRARHRLLELTLISSPATNG